jgi:riboflavin kinase
MSEETGGTTLVGRVTSGEGTAKGFVSLPGYAEQFREKLGYEPYPGTLNLALDEGSVRARPEPGTVDRITIEGWERDGRSFGAVHCSPVRLTVRATGIIHETAHTIRPERTGHELDTLEILAPVGLRDRYGLVDGDEVSVRAD